METKTNVASEDQTEDHGNVSVSSVPANVSIASSTSPACGTSCSIPVSGASHSIPVSGASHSSPVGGARHSIPVGGASRSSPVGGSSPDGGIAMDMEGSIKKMAGKSCSIPKKKKIKLPTQIALDSKGAVRIDFSFDQCTICYFQYTQRKRI